MPVSTAFIFFGLLIVIELVYFKLADRFNIIDKPNHRSSHTAVTIRGGGILFPLAVLLYASFFGLTYPWFISGLLMISLISFLDDILTLDSKLRFIVHMVSAILLMAELYLSEVSFLWWLPGLFFIIGTINAYNFMDGINGITGAYSMAVIASLWYVNERVLAFGSSPFMISVLIALLVFNLFNFRKKARCFAGDVGSVSMAFIVLFLLGELIMASGDLSFALFLLVYGLDTASTMVFRKLRGENIFEAHRSHFYQYLSNEKKWSHLMVSTLYALIQLVLNAFIVFSFVNWPDGNGLITILLIVIAAGAAFLFVRFKTEGRMRLLSHS